MVQNYMELYKYIEFIVMAHIWCKSESRDSVVSFSAGVLGILQKQALDNL